MCIVLHSHCKLHSRPKLLLLLPVLFPMRAHVPINCPRADGQLMDVVLACPALTHMDITGCTALSDRALAALISSYTRPPPAPTSHTAPTVTSARQQKGGHSSTRSHCSARPSPRHSGPYIGELPRCRLQLSHLCASHTHLGVRSLLALSRALTAAGGARGSVDDGDCGEEEEEVGEEKEEEEEVGEDESEVEDDKEEEEEDEEEDGASEGHETGDEEGVEEERREGSGVGGTFGGLRKLELDACPALHHALPLLHMLTAASPSLTHLSLAHTLAPGHMGAAAAPRGKGRGKEAYGGSRMGEGCAGAVDDALVSSWLHGARSLATQDMPCTSSSNSCSSDGTVALPHLTHLNVSDAPLSPSAITALCASAPRLRHLLISGWLAHAATLPRLTSLSLGGGFAWLSALHLTALASAAPLLRSLSLSSCPSLSQDAPLILANSFPALTSLTLTECSNLFSVHAPASLLALSALSALHLRHTGKQAPPDFIQQAASRLPALQHLTLDLCDALTSSFHVPQEGREEMHVMGDSLLVVQLFKCHVLHSSHAHSLTALTPSDCMSQKRTLGTKDVLVIARTTNGIATYVENVS
ncbi:unnamed protein product [Closterium sp. Yama58-4]|nr:unnamed protein product [Closterium sp. Yama58-4]